MGSRMLRLSPEALHPDAAKASEAKAKRQASRAKRAAADNAKK